MSPALQSKLNQALRLAPVVVAPFLFFPWAWETRETPRTHLLWLLTFGVTAAAVWRGELLRRLGRPVLAFLLVLLVAVAWCEEPLRSLFGPFPHGDSALSLAAAIVLVRLAPPREQLPAFSFALCAIAALQVAVAAVQRVGFGAAPAGTLGHPAFLGAFCAIAAPVAVGCLIDANTRPRAITSALALIVIVAGLALSGRRVATVVAAAACLAVTLLVPRARPRLLVAAAAALALFAVLGVLASAHDPLGAPALERFLGRERGFDGNLGARLDALRVALRAVGERPVLGQGFGAFGDLYASGKRSELFVFEGRAHSILVEIALGAGLAGLAAFLAVLVGWSRRALKTVRESREAPDAARLAACLAASAGYFLQLCFSFEQPAPTLWAASLASFAVGAGPDTQPAQPAQGARLRRGAVAAALAAAAAVSLLPLAGQVALASSRAAAQRGDFGRALGSARLAAVLLPSPCRGEMFEASLMQQAGNAVASARLLEGCLARHARAPLMHLALGEALLAAGDVDRAVAELAKARDEAPSYPPTLRAYARGLAAAGRLDTALAIIYSALELDWADAAAHDIRGDVLMRMGRRAEAIDAFGRAAAADPSQPEYRVHLERARSAR